MTRYFCFLVVVCLVALPERTELTMTTAWFPCRDHLRRCHSSHPRADKEPNVNPHPAGYQPSQSFDFLPYLRDPPSALWHTILQADVPPLAFKLPERQQSHMDIGHIVNIFQARLTLDTTSRCRNTHVPRSVSLNIPALGRGYLERTIELHITPQVALRRNKVSRSPGFDVERFGERIARKHRGIDERCVKRAR